MRKLLNLKTLNVFVIMMLLVQASMPTVMAISNVDNTKEGETVTPASIPVGHPTSGLEFVDVSGGTNHSIALADDGTVWAWGANSNGQLGNGANAPRNTPVQTLGLTDIVAVDAGVCYSVALSSDGTVWSWGANYCGQLGNGTNTDSSVPVQVQGLTDVVAISSGYEHAIALASDGTVWAWGANASGQLGNGTNTSSNVPIQVSGLTDIVAVCAGYNHSMALASDGTVWAWGWNQKGQLGNGTNANSNVPVQVSGLTNIVDIGAGYEHSIALADDGTVWSWGKNSSGQLGNGTNTDSNVPVQVQGLTDIVDVVAGNYHSIALVDNGAVWAWGHNQNGQLGNGTNAHSNVPVQVQGLTDIVAVGAGDYHSMVVSNDGTIWAWGENGIGELGDGTETDSNVPVEVLVAPAVPTVQTSNITQTGVTLSWTVPPKTESFDIYVNGVETVSDITDLTNTSYNITGLSPGTSYEIGVVASNSLGSSDGAVTTIVTIPSSPTDLVVSDITYNSVTLDWTASTGATSYDMYLNGTLVDTSTTTSYTFGSLASGTSYTLGVSAENASGASGITEVGTLTVPANPVNLVASDITQDSASLTWNASVGATSYDIYLDDVLIDTTTTTSYAFDNLDAGTMHQLGVSAKNASGTSSMNKVNVVTIPADPANLMVFAVTQDSITLEWATSTGATSYDIYLDGVLVDTSTVPSYTFDNLDSGTAYTLSVSAKNSSGVSGTTELETFTIPASPMNLIVSDITQDSVTLSWDTVTGADWYKLYLDGTLVDTTTTSSYVFDGLDSGTSYTLGVSSENVSGDSSVVTIDTLTIPSNPVNLVATDITQDSATLSWDYVNGAESYDIYVDGVLLDSVSAMNTYTLTNLEPGTTYTIGLSAKNMSGASGATEIEVITIPANPIDLVVSDITQDSVTLSWTASTGAVSYDIYLDGTLVDTSTTASYVFDGLDSGTSYTLGVSAENVNGTSSIVTVDTLTIPANPASLLVTDITTDSMFLSWDDSVGATSYDVYLDGVLVGTTVDNTFTFTNLDAFTTYELSVVASNSSGSSGVSIINVSTLAPASVNLTVSDIAKTSFTVSWDAISGADSYDVYLDGTLVGNTTTTSYAFTGLDSGTDYEVTVITKEDNATSLPASVDVFTKMDTPDVTVDAITINGAVISWNDVRGADSYDIYLNDVLIENVTDTEYTFTNIETDVDHIVNVVAVSSNTESTTSEDDIVYIDSDTDDDGLLDVDEIVAGTDPTIPDTDVDGLFDGDELDDSTGSLIITDPLDEDTDDDTLLDGDELDVNTGSPIVTDPTDPDTDNGGISDGQEVIDGTEPSVTPGDDLIDTDSDGLIDGEEAVIGTDPTDPDTDDGGVNDGQEVLDGTEPVNTPLDDLIDTDSDGLIDGEESVIGTDPNDPDTDDGGVNDGQEVLDGTEPVNTPLDDIIDTDEDGLIDGEEFTIGTDPTNPDTDDDGLNDGDEVNNVGTDPLNSDTDDGGVNDGQEVLDGTEPVNTPLDDIIDTDGDGLLDGKEIMIGTDPANLDTDNDGLPDGEEVTIGTDPVNPDTDGGGVSDGQEVAAGTDPTGTPNDDAPAPVVPVDDSTSDDTDEAEPAMVSPKTGDDVRLGLVLVLSITALVAGIYLLCHVVRSVGKRDKYEDDDIDDEDEE